VYIDGNYFASTPPSSFSWNSTTVPNGSHTISATAFSSAGVVAGTAAVNVTVNNGGPTSTPTIIVTPTPVVTPVPTKTVPAPTPTPASGEVVIAAPANGASVTGTAVAITVQKASNVTWVDVYIDGNYFAATPPSTFSWNSTTVPNGSHSISATAFSSTGSVLGTASIGVTVAN
jgi:hypothetical protein